MKQIIKRIIKKKIMHKRLRSALFIHFSYAFSLLQWGGMIDGRMDG